MYCPNCGRPNDVTYDFCQGCGQSLAEAKRYFAAAASSQAATGPGTGSANAGGGPSANTQPNSIPVDAAGQPHRSCSRGRDALGGIGDSVHADARAALAARDPAGVVRLLTPWLGEHGNDPVAWTLLAAAHFDLGDWHGLREAATQTVRLLPGSPSAWCNLGMALRKLGRLSEAREALERARDLDPSRRRTAQELAKVIRGLRGMDGSPSAPSAIRVPERPDAAAASPTPRPRGNAAPSPSSIPPVDVSREVPAGMPSHRDVRADLGGPQCSSDHGGGTEGEEEGVETWRPFDPPDPETPGTEFAEADEAESGVPPGYTPTGPPRQFGRDGLRDSTGMPYDKYGRTKCSWCRGTGVCSSCGGRGRDNVGVESLEQQCNMCSGTGRCSRCGGRGE